MDVVRRGLVLARSEHWFGYPPDLKALLKAVPRADAPVSSTDCEGFLKAILTVLGHPARQPRERLGSCCIDAVHRPIRVELRSDGRPSWLIVMHPDGERWPLQETLVKMLRDQLAAPPKPKPMSKRERARRRPAQGTP